MVWGAARLRGVLESSPGDVRCAARAERLGCMGSSGNVRLSACQPLGACKCWALALLRRASHSILLDSSHPREGSGPLLNPTRTPGTRFPGGFHSFTLSSHAVIEQAASCLAFLPPSVPLLWCFPEALKLWSSEGGGGRGQLPGEHHGQVP